MELVCIIEEQLSLNQESVVESTRRLEELALDAESFVTSLLSLFVDQGLPASIRQVAGFLIKGRFMSASRERVAVLNEEWDALQVRMDVVRESRTILKTGDIGLRTAASMILSMAAMHEVISERGPGLLRSLAEEGLSNIKNTTLLRDIIWTLGNTVQDLELAGVKTSDIRAFELLNQMNSSETGLDEAQAFLNCLPAMGTFQSKQKWERLRALWAPHCLKFVSADSGP